MVPYHDANAKPESLGSGRNIFLTRAPRDETEESKHAGSNLEVGKADSGIQYLYTVTGPRIFPERNLHKGICNLFDYSDR